MQEKDLLAYVAGLARIHLSPEEAAVIEGQFINILHYIEKLKEVNVDGIAPMRIVHNSTNIFNQDLVKSFSAREAIINNAPAQEDGCFKVPNIIV